MANKRIVQRQVPEAGRGLQTGLHPILERVYQHRGVASTLELEHDLASLISFKSLKNIEAACTCLHEALLAQKRILIVGDFDTDGATSTTLAVTALRAFGAKHVDFIVPNRFEYGYGLTPEIVDVANNYEPQLIITVDNGIASHDGVSHARAKGIDVLVTDHHLPAETLPEATAIVNPNQVGDEFASKNLAGVGVIFYVMLALRAHLRDHKYFETQKVLEPNMGQFLDLVALGTVADVVPLDYNNRILVQQGLKRIREGHCRPGIKALLKIAKRNIKNIVAADMGFAIAPRLNAAGRLDDMTIGILCLLSGDNATALKYAQQLDELNKTRREIEADMQKSALAEISKLHLDQETSTVLPLALSLYEPTWHQGVIGIVASRIKDKLHRPVVAFAKAEEGMLKGSCRSIPGLHIRDVLAELDSCNPGLIPKFGGHAMAAGLSLAEADFKKFKVLFAEQVAKHITPLDCEGVILSDGNLGQGDFSLNLAEQLRAGGPWGQNFPEPIFDNRFKILQQRLVGGKHLKMVLEVENKARMVDAIAFNVDINQWPNYRCEEITAAFRLDINEYNGQRSLQLVVDHLQAEA